MPFPTFTLSRASLASVPRLGGSVAGRPLLLILGSYLVVIFLADSAALADAARRSVCAVGGPATAGVGRRGFLKPHTARPDAGVIAATLQFLQPVAAAAGYPHGTHELR